MPSQETSAPRTAASICRNCLAYCPIVVTVEDGRATQVAGDREAPLFDGYTCPKGRALPAQHNDPERLLRPQARQPDGSFAPLDSARAIEEIAARVQEILARDGPRAIALYGGTGVVSHPPGPAMAKAWFRAIGSPMLFSAATIDKPAANTSTALHGNWVAGAQPFETADTWMIVGANPVIAKSNGAPSNNPGQRIKEAVRRGLKLIVVDPRRTETAKRAHVHLQAKAGEDPTVLAAIIRIVISEGLLDAAFVAENARGLDALAAAVAPFTPEYAATRAGIAVDALLDAARTFGRGRRGGVVCSTGPSFSTHSTLTYYLALCLNTLCGRWARAGDAAPYPNVLLPAFTPKAQPYPPYPVFGTLRMPGSTLRENASGLPTAGLADAILAPGGAAGAPPIRALFCVGGNPVLSWPDTPKTKAALESLELLVVCDYRLTPTARFAHYVIPPPLSLELPGSTAFVEALKYNGVARGFDVPWAQYTPAVLPPPAGSDLLDEAALFFRLAQTMRLQLEWTNIRGYGPHVESPKQSIPLDMSRMPTTDELIALTTRGSRVPLDEVRRHPHGRVFDEATVRVQPRDADCTARLELADPLMLADLRAVLESSPTRAVQLVHAASGPAPDARAALERDPRSIADAASGALTLVCRRTNNFMNSVGQNLPRLSGGRASNALFMHPSRMAALALDDGDDVDGASRAGRIVVPVTADDSLRADTVALCHGFGDASGGASVTALVDLSEADPITGIPRMSAIPVTVRRAPRTDAPARPVASRAEAAQAAAARTEAAPTPAELER
jgi:anaerobic selenocysteine-containing dehydrogenase